MILRKSLPLTGSGILSKMKVEIGNEKVEINNEIVSQFVPGLCESNLKNKRVQCCSCCPYEPIIILLFKNLAPLFEEKREMVRQLPENNKWRRTLEKLKNRPGKATLGQSLE